MTFRPAAFCFVVRHEVSLVEGPNEIHALSVQYTAAAPGRLGQVVSQGPGWLRGAMSQRPGMGNASSSSDAASGPPSFLEARWKDQLLVRPDKEKQPHVAADQQQQLISLTGGAEIKFQAINQLNADEIHFWLWELPQGAAASAKLQPDRMFASGNVRVDSPQFSSAVEELNIWFKQIAPATAASRPTISPGPPSRPIRRRPMRRHCCRRRCRHSCRRRCKTAFKRPPGCNTWKSSAGGCWPMWSCRASKASSTN